MSKYAEQTSVPAGKSREEIEKVLARYGADQFMYGWDETKAMIQFRADGRYVRFLLEMPDRNDREFTHTPERGTQRSPTQAEKFWEQATRQRWRALALVVKAKLEAVEAGIATFESEFMAHVVLPTGQTVGEVMIPKIAEAYETGVMPQLMPGGSDEQ